MVSLMSKSKSPVTQIMHVYDQTVLEAIEEDDLFILFSGDQLGIHLEASKSTET